MTLINNLSQRVDSLEDDDDEITYEELLMADLRRAHGYGIDENLEQALDRGDLDRALARSAESAARSRRPSTR